MSPFLHFPVEILDFDCCHPFSDVETFDESRGWVRVVSDAGRGITVNRPGSRDGSVIFEFLTLLLLLLWLRVLLDPSQALPMALGKQEDMEPYDADSLPRWGVLS
jgi:hypothetical protein